MRATWNFRHLQTTAAGVTPEAVFPKSHGPLAVAGFATLHNPAADSHDF
ncbi:MAG: hypothetical protein ACOY6E_13485 [Pseudomonadota bacterium]